MAEVVHVPEGLVGWIIGKGGNTLRELQEHSRAKIDLPRVRVCAGVGRARVCVCVCVVCQ